MWRAAANILNKQSRAADSGRSSSLMVGEALTALHLKIYRVMKHLTRPRTWTDSVADGVRD
jgi:hypothetical protein